MEDQLILDRYRLISEAGSGGFATVQLAWDTVIKRRVAIKCIQLDQQATARLDAGPAKMPAENCPDGKAPSGNSYRRMARGAILHVDSYRSGICFESGG